MTKPKITITQTKGNIQFDIRQGNQTRWFSVGEETARELYGKLGSVLYEQTKDDWIDREMALLELKALELDAATCIAMQQVKRDYPVERFTGSKPYETERQHVPNITKEGISDER